MDSYRWQLKRSGFAGGQIVGEGTPEEIAEIEESHNGKYLKEAL